MKRSDSRLNDQLRKVKIIPDYLAHPAGSALIDIGGTKVICAGLFRARRSPVDARTGSSRRLGHL
ncbi:MAG: hypothetical protein V8T87_07015 [Victivallales bacterium]